MVNPASSSKVGIPLSTDMCLLCLGVRRVGAGWVWSSSGALVKGTTNVKSSFLDALDIGLSVTVGRRGVCRGIPASSLGLLRIVDGGAGTCDLAGVREEVALAVDLTADF
jgi:hypothetical protein